LGAAIVSFSIVFSDGPLEYLDDDPSIPSAIGLLTIGDFREDFAASLYLWSKEDYESQWRDAIGSLLEGRDRAALIVEYVGPEAAGKLEWWPMYVVRETVFFQNHLLFYDQLSQPFSIHDPYASLRDRRTINEDGDHISEWSVSFSEIEKFARSLGL
jgi:hypothetical protein